MRNPYLFVVGCPRSGTTLLQRMLDHHPLLAVANDSHFIPHGIEDRSAVDPPLTPEIVGRVRTYRRFYRLGLPDEAVDQAAARARTYSEFVGVLYDEIAQTRGKQLAGEKTPTYVRHLPLLHGLFPAARVVHIIRDGRDVTLSALGWATETKGPGKLRLWREEPVAVCALWWQRNVRTGRRDGRDLGPARYREVRFEALVESPSETLGDLLRFLGLPLARETLTFHEGKVRRDPGLSTKKAWLPPTPGLRDWRKEMPSRDVELFEALAGDLLVELGYERRVDTVSPAIAAVARRCRRRWEAELGELRKRAEDARDAGVSRRIAERLRS